MLGREADRWEMRVGILTNHAQHLSQPKLTTRVGVIASFVRAPCRQSRFRFTAANAPGRHERPHRGCTTRLNAEDWRAACPLSPLVDVDRRLLNLRVGHLLSSRSPYTCCHRPIRG